MVQKVKKINKAFILAGGVGSRIKLNNRYNLKAFIEIVKFPLKNVPPNVFCNEALQN